MGGTGGSGEAPDGRFGEAGGVFRGERSGFGGGNSQPSPGKNISNLEQQVQISALQAQVHELVAQKAAITVHTLTEQFALLKTENASLKSANESLTADVARLTQQSNNHTCPPTAASTIPDLASIDMNAVMQLTPSQLNTLDAGLRRLRTRILATTDGLALRRLVENEVPLLLMSVGVSMDLYVGSFDGWHDFCARGNSSQFRLEALYSHRRKNIEGLAGWTSYAMTICLDVVYKLCVWRNIS